MDEFQLIEWIKKKAGKPPRGWEGIGDDAAVMPPTASRAWTIATDMIVEGVDFDRRVSPRQAGRKALAINLSDMAAMGARPRAFLITLGISSRWKNKAKIQSFLNGIFNLAKQHSLVCVGGDMSGAKQFFCGITVWGDLSGKKFILRRGAKPGDVLFVTGSIGGSIQKKHFAFTPRLLEGAWLARQGYPSAMLDISDGLIQDLGHLARSSGCRARLNVNEVPLSREARNVSRALADGEDFELLMSVPPKKAAGLLKMWPRVFPRVKLTAIGTMTRGKAGIDFWENGVLLKKFSAHAGYKHF